MRELTPKNMHVATAIHPGADAFLTLDANQRLLAEAEGMGVPVCARSTPAGDPNTSYSIRQCLLAGTDPFHFGKPSTRSSTHLA